METKILSRLLRTIGLTAVLAAVLVQLQPPLSVCAAQQETAVRLQMEDGEYAIDVTMEGGSGRAAVSSPAKLIVMDGRAYACVEWSSSNYDYMKVGGEVYLPVNEEGNSIFEIPIIVFDEPMLVIGDTTAMSAPHEVEYTLTFAEDSIAAAARRPQAAQGVFYIVAVIAVLCAAVLIAGRKRRRSKR